MTDRKKNREKMGYTYLKQSDDPDLWYKNSVSFHEAATVLYENQKRVTNALKIFQFNAATSLELIFKAILVAKGIIIPKTHNLRELSQIADVGLDQDQKYTLDLLTESISWLARYPIPISEAKWDNFHDNIYEKQKVQLRLGNTDTLVANPKRFPSMENYMKIWEISRSKYLEFYLKTKH